ncbi:MAG: hypothetical protein JRI25_10465 [Deltaproteobacteria bacterium]|nr:hypothetical protein [Deltaproteobacteria bacterium]
MGNSILLGVSRHMIPVPCSIWQFLIRREAAGARARSARKLTAEHHRVRDFVVREIATRGEPLTPATIAAELALPVDRVVTLLDELERGMVYLFREGGDDVVWAYPATAATTPHYLTWSTGECSYAA